MSPAPLNSLDILLQQRSFRQQAYASRQTADGQPQSTLGSVPVNGEPRQQPLPVADSRQAAGNAAPVAERPGAPSAARGIVQPHEQQYAHPAAASSLMPPPPARSTAPMVDGVHLTAPPIQALHPRQTPSTAQLLAGAPEPWLASSSRVPAGPAGPGERAEGSAAASGERRPASFLDKAAQLLKEEAKAAALSQEQQRAVQQHTVGRAALGAGPGPSSEVQRRSGRSPTALHPVSYHQPPSAAQPGSSQPRGGLPLVAVGAGSGSSAAKAAVASHGAPQDKRSPAEQLGLRRSGWTGATESTPLAAVPLAAAGGTNDGRSAGKTFSQSPWDEGVLAQIEALERQAQQVGRKALERYCNSSLYVARALHWPLFKAKDLSYAHALPPTSVQEPQEAADEGPAAPAAARAQPMASSALGPAQPPAKASSTGTWVMVGPGPC